MVSYILSADKYIRYMEVLQLFNITVYKRLARHVSVDSIINVSYEYDMYIIHIGVN
jgi:hypothetical protein